MKSFALLLLCLLYGIHLSAQNWMEHLKIVAPDRDREDRFSKSIAISGDFAVIGAHRENRDENGNNQILKSGGAYFFKRDNSGNWNFHQKVVPADRAEDDNFGTAVSISGNYAAIAAYKKDTTLNDVFYYQTGTVYLFEKDENDHWQQKQQLFASDFDSLNYFGKSVSISVDHLIVGAAYRNEYDTQNHLQIQAGVAYIFERNANGVWIEKQKLIASDLAPFDIFGWSVSIEGDIAVVGAYKQDKDNNGHNSKKDAGAAYVFERDNASGNWGQTSKLTASDRSAGDWFGYSVSNWGDYIVVGAHQEDPDENGLTNLSNAGAAYIFKRDNAGNWTEQTKIVASDRTAGDEFGYSVAINNQNIVVGARKQDLDENSSNNMPDAGAAYIYQLKNNQWLQTDKLTHSDRRAGDWLGFSVAIDNTTCFAGAFAEDEDAQGHNTLPNAGSVYIFTTNQTLGATTLSQQQLNIYPNPTTDIINISLPQNTTVKTVEIYNLSGEKMHSQNNVNSISLSTFEKGIYILKIVDENNNTTTQQIVKD